MHWEYRPTHDASIENSSETLSKPQPAPKPRIFSDFAAEIVKMIFDCLSDVSSLTDIVCLALVDTRLWTIGLPIVRRLFAQARAPWAGTRVICVGDSKDLPPNLELPKDLQAKWKQMLQQPSSWDSCLSSLLEFPKSTKPYEPTALQKALREIKLRLQGYDRSPPDQLRYFQNVHGRHERSKVWFKPHYTDLMQYYCGFQPSIEKLMQQLELWVDSECGDDGKCGDLRNENDGENKTINSLGDEDGEDDEYYPDESDPASGESDDEEYAEVSDDDSDDASSDDSDTVAVHEEYMNRAKQDLLVLRNFTKRVYVCGSALPRKLTLQNVILCYMSWSSKSPFEVDELGVHRGKWVADQVDVCEEWRMRRASVQDVNGTNLENEWRDVSEEVVQMITTCSWYLELDV